MLLKIFESSLANIFGILPKFLTNQKFWVRACTHSFYTIRFIHATFHKFKTTYSLPLSAVTASLHYLPRYLRSAVTCGKKPTNRVAGWLSHKCAKWCHKKLL